MPNNRQWALIFWVVAFIAWVLYRPDTRASTLSVLRAAVAPKILVSMSVLAAWVVGLVYLASQVGLWDADRVTDTVFWFVTAGLVLFGRFGNVSKERHFVRRAAFTTLEVSAVVEVLSEVVVLAFAAEFVLQPSLALLGALSVVAAQKQEHRQVKRLVDALVAGVSLGLLLFVVVSVITNWGSLDKADLLQQFMLPIWLTIGVLPYIYAVGLLSAYGLAFIRIDWKSQRGWWERTRAKLALMTSFHVKALEVGSFTGAWQLKLAAASSFGEGRRVVAEFRASQREAALEAEERQARLVRHAGVDGVDEQGRRLDRREFKETTTTLRWIATCQMGWYRNTDVCRYRADLLDFVLDGPLGERLPDQPLIHLHVSDDGRKWYAWRRTVSGWVFAIGAAGPPPDQWEYDGASPPTGFPGEDPVWGPGPFVGDASVNW